MLPFDQNSTINIAGGYRGGLATLIANRIIIEILHHGLLFVIAFCPPEGGKKSHDKK